MILSMQVMEAMTDNVEFVRELIKIIKKCFQDGCWTPSENKEKSQLLNYTTCEGEIQIKVDPNKNISKVFFKNEFIRKEF